MSDPLSTHTSQLPVYHSPYIVGNGDICNGKDHVTGRSGSYLFHKNRVGDHTKASREETCCECCRCCTKKGVMVSVAIGVAVAFVFSLCLVLGLTVSSSQHTFTQEDSTTTATTVMPPMKCLETDFPCANEKECVTRTKVCDSTSDCSDGSDEWDCGSSSKAIDTTATTDITTTSSTVTPIVTTPSCRPCADGRCVKTEYWCDGYNDCLDGSDETDCDCTGFFECPSGRCIFTSWHCDGDNDCGDYGDETNCTCDNGFECEDSLICLKLTAKCDGYEDCLDGSDEKFCACSSSERRCTDGTCILAEWFCDGHIDCSDGDDEENCVGEPHANCSASEFRCADHAECVLSTSLCDLSTDCSDGSDEWDCVTILSALGETYHEVVMITLQSNQTVPICATHWNDAWNDVLCKETGAGSARTSDTVDSNTVIPGSTGGFAMSVEGGVPAKSILEVQSGTISSSCSDGIVKVTCNYDECGTRSPQISTSSRRKILEGYTAQPGTWPWQISLRYDSDHNCGGSLICPGVVVTAAHCVEKDPRNAQNFDVWLGTVNSKVPDNTYQKVTAQKIIMHEDYDTHTLENDIAIIILTSNITYTDYIRPVCLPTNTTAFFQRDEFVECYTSGWGGIDEEAKTFPDNLQEAKMGLINDTVCGSDSDIAHFGLYEEVMLCAGYTHGYITVCNGDSGGPLVCRDKRNVWTLAGITSWGPVDAFVSCKGISVYTEVSNFTNWIQDTTAGYCG